MPAGRLLNADKLTVALFLIANTLALATAGRHDVSDAEFVELGTAFKSTGRVLPDGGCTLIAPTWAVTAAHVGESIRPGKSKVAFEGKEYVVKRVVKHPNWMPHQMRPDNIDIALLELAKPVDHVHPIALYPSNDESDQTTYIVGFGDIGDGRSRPKRMDGQRRAVTNMIFRVDDDRLMVKFDEGEAGTEMEGVGAPGDSGGPMIMRKDGKDFLVGVSHASMNGKPGRYGVIDIYMRISTKLKWIEKVTGIKPSID